MPLGYSLVSILGVFIFVAGEDPDGDRGGPKESIFAGEDTRGPTADGDVRGPRGDRGVFGEFLGMCAP